MGLVLVCLLRVQWDGGVDQVEGSVLGGGGCGDFVEGRCVEGDGVAGQGGQVVKQAAEAVARLAVGVEVAAGFVLGAGGAGRGGDGVVSGGWVFVGVGQRG